MNKRDFDYILSLKNKKFDVDYINKICQLYPGSKILIEVDNTKGITSDMIKKLDPSICIRIAGGYDDYRLEKYKGATFKDKDTKKIETAEEIFYDSVIYTSNETIKILEQMERLELGIDKNWSDLQKMLYVYEKLKRNIMYDPKYKMKDSKDTRSLRGLLTRKTVCAGFALIFKELMDRSGIECEYARGYGHAWNIVVINGKKYPVDLTWDNTAFRAGKFESLDWLTKSVKEFCKSHKPDPREKTQDYEHTLCQLDPEIIKQCKERMRFGAENNYYSTVYKGKRKDGSEYIVAQVQHAEIDGKNYYRYFYQEIFSGGKRSFPLILYSETNVSHLVNAINFGKKIPDNYEEAVDNILFSRENINDSLKKGTYYIGNVIKSKDSNKINVVRSVREVSKPYEISKKFNYETRRYQRSDGSVIIAQRTGKSKFSFSVKGIPVIRYDIFEMTNVNGREILKKNCVYTERDFFEDNRQSMVDYYLNRERLARKVKEAGGYIGYYDENGTKRYNPDLVSYFESSKVIDVKKVQLIPTFDELKSLVMQYETFNDKVTGELKVRDLKKNIVVNDPDLTRKSIFANMWLYAAGIKSYYNETRPGVTYAFSDCSKELYDNMCKIISNQINADGVIDTSRLFEGIKDSCLYKYNQEVIVNMFRTPFQTNFVNNLFQDALGISSSKKIPVPLYNLPTAGNNSVGRKK